MQACEMEGNSTTVKGPNSQGLNVPVKQAKTIRELERIINGRHRQSST